MKLFRRFFQTKPAKRLPCKIKPHPPLACSKSVTLEDGSIFTKLNNDPVKTISKESLNKAPLLKNRQGDYLDTFDKNRIIEDYKKGGQQNSLTQLSKRYNVSRGFIINNIFDKETREKFMNHLDKCMLEKTTRQQKGHVFSRLIRNKRENSWTD